jgi:hypothetical protein
MADFSAALLNRGAQVVQGSFEDSFRLVGIWGISAWLTLE